MMRRLRKAAILLFFGLVLAAPSASALVLCTTPDGRTFAGDEPPPGCVAKGERLDPKRDPERSTPKADVLAPNDPPVNSGPEHPFGAEQQAAEMDRRRRIPAIAMRSIANMHYENGRFLQGTVANAADFPVYDVRICVDSGNTCRTMVPSTLHPGAQATFSFPTNLIGVPDYIVTWDVVPR
jgi:hypothetical protein